jgi:hypothetical protein
MRRPLDLIFKEKIYLDTNIMETLNLMAIDLINIFNNNKPTT